MNPSSMHRAEEQFNCEPVAAERREIFTDPHFGEMMTGPMPEPVEAEPATVEHDPDLGPLVVGIPSAAGPLPRRTGPPAFAAYVLACALCIALNGIVAFTALAAGR